MPIAKNLPLVPAERALKVIGGRWKVFVLYFLFEGPQRLSQLRRLIPDVSQKVLVQQLREMEQHGVVHREVFAQVPPRVVYTATALGLSLRPIVGALCEWGRHHAAELDALEQRDERDQRAAPPASEPRATRAKTPARRATRR
jgi:DNA-binding HxlR family transcriptional regulator